MFEKKGIDYWASRELTLTRRRLALQNSLTDVELAAGTALLDAESDEVSIGASLDLLERAHAEIRALDVAIRAARSRRLESIRSKRAAEAKALRRDAASKREEAQSISKKTAELLAEISGLQGVNYPLSLLSQNPATGIWDCPRGPQLENEAGNLESRAADLERAEVRRDGMLDLENVADLDQVVRAVLEFEADGPTAADVLAWLEAVLRRAPQIADHQIDCCRLVWKDRMIDTDQSCLQVNSLMRMRTSQITGEEIPDGRTAEFRAA